MKFLEAMAVGVLLLGLAGCQAAGFAAAQFALTAVAKAFEIDTAIINHIRAERDALSDPNMKGAPRPEFQLDRSR